MTGTEHIVRDLYRAFLSGDKDGMLALMHEDVDVRFLGQAHLCGRAAASDFFDFAGTLLRDVEFSLQTIVVDGEHAAGIWQETAVTANGEPWSNHGVDVVRVRDGLVVSLHENNDVREVYRHFPAYVPRSGSQAES